MNHDLVQNAIQTATDTVTERYEENRDDKRTEPNWRKLKALVRLLGLTPTQVARAAGVSRPYASRLLNETDPFVGSSIFYRRVEANLGKLVDSRTAQFFAVEAVPLDDVALNG